MNHPPVKGLAGYAYRDDIAIADAAFRAWGETCEAVFVQAARATLNVMVEKLESIAGRQTRPLRLEADNLELLLFDFLNEFLFYKDAEQLLLLPEKVEIAEREGGWSLYAWLAGERLDPQRHCLLVDVKAVTLYGFQLEQHEQGWWAAVVLDI